MNYQRAFLFSLPITIAAAAIVLPRCLHADEPSAATETAQTEIASGEKVMKLNGSALRTVFGFKVYRVSLYTCTSMNSEQAVYACPDPKRIHIEMLRDVSGAKFESTITKNIDVNFSDKEKQEYAPQLKAFLAALVEGVSLSKGTDINIEFVPGTGTKVSVAGKDDTVIPGDEFYHALLRLWIGSPPQGSVKKGLLVGRHGH